MKQLSLIPEPTRDEMIAEMLGLWIASESTDIVKDGYEACREAHKKYYTQLFRIERLYGRIPYPELSRMLRQAEEANHD